MTLTLEDVLRIRKETGILYTPDPDARDNRLMAIAATPATAKITVKNTTSSGNLYAIISGINLSNGVPMFLQSDGVTAYYPAQPPTDQYPVQANIGILIGGPGASRSITVPKIAGGRIWYSKDSALTFKLNRGGNGAAIVEPSSTNPSDASYKLNWGFTEFTYDNAQMFANITYVDFVSIPVSMSLTHASGGSVSVLGLPSDGISKIATALEQQSSKEGVAGWGRLVVRDGSRIIRVLSPNSGMVMDGSNFAGYFDAYVSQVWSKYTSESISVNTQAGWGTVTGKVVNNALTFNGVGSIGRPSTQNIFGCVGVFPGSNDEIGNIGARVAAGFNRGTLLKTTSHPDGAGVDSYYTVSGPTNHYSRILHATNLDGLGYAFPYDDVGPTGGKKQEGAVSSGNPGVLTINVGGGTSFLRREAVSLARPGRQLVGGRRVRRGLEWSAPEEEMQEMHESAPETYPDEKAALAQADIDLERGIPLATSKGSLEAETQATPPQTLLSLLPESWVHRAQAAMERLESSPAYAKLRPFVELLMRAVTLILSLSLRAIVSRVSMIVLVIMFYVLLGPIGKVLGFEADHMASQGADFEGGLKRQFG